MNDSVDTDTGLREFMLTVDPLRSLRVPQLGVADDPGRTGHRD